MFGVPLFLRSRRGITPTAFGTALFSKASLLLADWTARAMRSKAARGGAGHVRLGALQVALPELVPRTLARLRAEQPGSRCWCRRASDVLLAALGRGELDCVLGRMTWQMESGGFRWEVLYDEPVCLVARSGIPWRDAQDDAGMHGARWILPPREARCGRRSSTISSPIACRCRGRHRIGIGDDQRRADARHRHDRRHAADHGALPCGARPARDPALPSRLGLPPVGIAMRCRGVGIAGLCILPIDTPGGGTGTESDGGALAFVVCRHEARSTGRDRTLLIAAVPPRPCTASGH